MRALRLPVALLLPLLSLLPLLLLPSACGGRTPVTSALPTTDAGAVTPAPPPGSAGCTGKSVIALDGNTLVRIAADAPARRLFTFGAASGLASPDVSVGPWDLQGRYVAGYAFLDPNGGPAHHYEYVLLDVDGHVLFHRIQDEPYNPTLHLGADGTVAVAAGSNWLVRPDGSTVDLGPYAPAAARVGDAIFVAVGPPTQTARPMGWLNLADLSFANVVGTEVAFSSLGGRVAYVAGEGSSGTLMLAGASGSPTGVALPAGSGDGAWRIVATAADRFVLLAGGGASLAVVDAQAQTAATVAGARSLQSGPGGDVALDDQGRVLAAFAIPAADSGPSFFQVRRTSDAGQHWEDVGTSVPRGTDHGAGSWLHPVARAGGVLIMALDMGYGLYLHQVELASSRPAVSLPVDANGLYLNGAVSPGGADLSLDGQCAASWVQGAGAPADSQLDLDLTFVDPSGAPRRVAHTGDGRPAWFRFVN